MKNTLKVLGIIAFVAVIGFSMAACDGGGGGGLSATLIVINAYHLPITKVVAGYSKSKPDLNDTTGIPVGEQKTFTIPFEKEEDSGYFPVYLTTSDGNEHSGSPEVNTGKTTTITLNANGYITVNP